MWFASQNASKLGDFIGKHGDSTKRSCDFGSRKGDLTCFTNKKNGFKSPKNRDCSLAKAWIAHDFTMMWRFKRQQRQHHSWDLRWNGTWYNDQLEIPRTSKNYDEISKVVDDLTTQLMTIIYIYILSNTPQAWCFEHFLYWGWIQMFDKSSTCWRHVWLPTREKLWMLTRDSDLSPLLFLRCFSGLNTYEHIHLCFGYCGVTWRACRYCGESLENITTGQQDRANFPLHRLWTMVRSWISERTPGQSYI